MGSDKAFVGKHYRSEMWSTASVDLMAYARATQDTHHAYQGAHAIMQPMAVVLATASLGVAKVVGDKALIGDSKRLLKLLHSAEDITWRQTLVPGDAFVVRTQLASIDTTAAGETLHVVTQLHRAQDGETSPWAVQAKTALFIRERSRLPPRVKTATPTLIPALPQVVESYTQTWHINDDLAQRYAAASGDTNPIHLDVATAQKAGLKGCVVHGLCTMAFVARALVDGFGQSHPGRLGRLALRFVRPVYLGEVLTLKAQRYADETVRFVVTNQTGHNVLEQGQAMMRTAVP